MSHMKEPQLSGFSALLLHHIVVLLLTHSCGGQLQVSGTSQPIVAMVGDDIILPCHLETAVDATGLTVEWTRPDLEPSVVLLRRDGVQLQHEENPLYVGRTSLSTNQLKRGDISMTLSEVKVSDAGTYKCLVPKSGPESVVELTVGSVSSPFIDINKVSSGVVLDCESRGWYPEPEVLWLDGEGNLLSAGPTETVTGPDDLYTVSSRVTVEKRHSNSFTCRVQQRTINQTRETHITVPDDFFSASSGSRSSSSASTIIGLVVGFMFILAVAFVVWKWRQNKIENKEHHVDEETQRGEKKSNPTSNDSEQEFLIERESDNRETLTAERQTMKNQDKMEDKHHVDCLSEGSGRSYQNEEETHQEKAGGETGKVLDYTEEETKPINKEAQAPPPEQRDTHQEEPEDTNTEAAAQSREEVKPAGQVSTDGEKDELEETGGQKGKSDATPCPTEREGQHKENTADREMMKNSSRSEGTGCSSQNEEETHQEKAGGETGKDLDNTEEKTKLINEETQAPPPAENDTHQEEPEDTNTEAAAQSQMDKEEINPAGQGLTDGEKDDVEETGGQTGESDAAPCPTERQGQHEKNTKRRDGALSPAEGQTDQLPQILNGLNKKDEDGKTESNKEPARQNAIEEETQRNENQPGGGRKPAGQGPTDGEKDDLEQILGKTGNSDATQEIDGALSLAEGQTYQLPKALNDVNNTK